VIEAQPFRDEDPDLIDRFRRGDADAFDELATLHRRPIYLVARRLLGSHEDADEAAQLTLLRAWKARGQFRGDAALRTWLTRIALNVSKTMLSNRKMQTDPIEAAAEPRDPAEGAERGLSRGQARERVRLAVVGLPPRQREVVLLKVFSEMTYREVAQTLQLSEGAVKAHLHQAVSNLRRSMSTTREEIEVAP
jgi:RNA polymerase sigma-70 factor (ECF subfamily)